MIHRILFIGTGIMLVFLFPAAFSQSCGDGTCDVGENSCTCDVDCGTCSGAVPSRACEEYSCDESDICRPVKISGCCGNLVCETGENYGSCPADCVPTSLNMDILEPTPGKVFRHGETVLLKARLDADGRSVAGAEVMVQGLPEEIKLLNDGQHGDELIGDNVYGFFYTIPREAENREYTVFFDARFQNVEENGSVLISVSDELETDFELLDRYELGDVINVLGAVTRVDNDAVFPVRFSVSFNGTVLGEEIYDMDEDGSFHVRYRTSLLDPVGDWDVLLEGNDLLGNRVEAQNTIRVSKPRETEFLDIVMVSELNEQYVRGESLEVVATVLDPGGSPVSGASVTLQTPEGKSIPLQELQEGKYSVLYTLPYSLPEGNQSFSLSVLNTTDILEQRGNVSFETAILPASLEVRLIDPTGEFFRAGDALNPVVTVRYPTGEPVSNATVIGLINNREITFSVERVGLYRAEYVFQEDDEGTTQLHIDATDAYGNSHFTVVSFEVAGISILYFLLQNFWVFAIALLVIGGASYALYYQYRTVSGVDHMIQRKKQLTELQTELQEDYFKRGSIAKDEYLKLNNEYAYELAELEEKLKAIPKSPGKKGGNDS